MNYQIQEAEVKEPLLVEKSYIYDDQVVPGQGSVRQIISQPNIPETTLSDYSIAS
jgi:hypothetical protein